MIRIGRLTDYGIILMTRMAARPERTFNAAELATEAKLPGPTVSKVLRTLARCGLLESRRGVKGGFGLARAPEHISVAEIIRALEGPIALTACNAEQPSECEHEPLCPVRGHWYRINEAVRHALEGVSLSEMATPVLPTVGISPKHTAGNTSSTDVNIMSGHAAQARGRDRD